MKAHQAVAHGAISAQTPDGDGNPPANVGRAMRHDAAALGLPGNSGASTPLEAPETTHPGLPSWGWGSPRRAPKQRHRFSLVPLRYEISCQRVVLPLRARLAQRRRCHHVQVCVQTSEDGARGPRTAGSCRKTRGLAGDPRLRCRPCLCDPKQRISPAANAPTRCSMPRPPASPCSGCDWPTPFPAAGSARSGPPICRSWISSQASAGAQARIFSTSTTNGDARPPRSRAWGRVPARGSCARSTGT